MLLSTCLLRLIKEQTIDQSRFTHSSIYFDRRAHHQGDSVPLVPDSQVKALRRLLLHSRSTSACPPVVKARLRFVIGPPRPGVKEPSGHLGGCGSSERQL